MGLIYLSPFYHKPLNQQLKPPLNRLHKGEEGRLIRIPHLGIPLPPLTFGPLRPSELPQILRVALLSRRVRILRDLIRGRREPHLYVSEEIRGNGCGESWGCYEKYSADRAIDWLAIGIGNPALRNLDGWDDYQMRSRCVLFGVGLGPRCSKAFYTVFNVRILHESPSSLFERASSRRHGS